MIDVLTNAISQFKTLAGLIASAIAIWFAITTWLRTRALVPVLGALLLGAVVVIGIANFDTLIKDNVQEDVDKLGTGGG